MTHVFLVTLVLDIDGAGAADAAAALFAQDAVVTVRMSDGAPSVIRLDVDATGEREAAAAANELASAVARRLRCAISIRSVQAVPDRDRSEIAGQGHGQM
jgi:hypothetical protein